MTPKYSRSRSHMTAIAIGFSTVMLTGCENLPDAFKPKTDDPTEPPALAGSTLTLEERDVEAPEIFNVIDEGLWDGRPSFGGVWVAYPGNTQPERVNIRNVSNGKSVVGALFKREADNPGPKITVSSDAADALGVLAGTPTKLTITALRREPIEVIAPGQEVEAPELLSETVLAPVGSTAGPSPEGTQNQSTQEVAVSVEQALKDVQTGETATVKKPPVKPVVATAPAQTSVAPSGDQPRKPYIQVATLSSDANARALVEKLSAADLPAEVKKSTNSSGKSLFRVIAGPATSAEQLSLFSSKIKGLGFKDAFPVSK